MTALVGIDVGTTGVKGVAISTGGEVLASAEEHYELSTPHPGWAEQEPEDWWRAAEAVRAQLPEGPIGFSGQMHGLVVLGSTTTTAGQLADAVKDAEARRAALIGTISLTVVGDETSRH